MTEISKLLLLTSAILVLCTHLPCVSSSPINWDNIKLNEEQELTVQRVDDLLNEFLKQLEKMFREKHPDFPGFNMTEYNSTDDLQQDLYSTYHSLSQRPNAATDVTEYDEATESNGVGGITGEATVDNSKGREEGTTYNSEDGTPVGTGEKHPGYNSESGQAQGNPIYSSGNQATGQTGKNSDGITLEETMKNGEPVLKDTNSNGGYGGGGYQGAIVFPDS